MSEPQPDMKKADATALYHAANAAKYAAKVWLPEGAEDKQVRVVAEKIYLAAAADLIASGKFTLPDRPRNFAEKITAERTPTQDGLALG